MHLINITLETSLKPFKRTDDAYVESVCRHLFQQWRPLLKDADMASVLLWTADGSEILDYQGDLSTPLEWGRYIGSANPHWTVPGDPDKKSIHSKSYLYTENPPTITYADLKRIVATLKRVGREVTGLPIRVGETFDPGCEFAKSPWKYERHREVCLADTGGPKSFMCCYGVLNGDTRRYAGFPDGIPDQTALGTFVGRQARLMMQDIGFDYIWLSNGFGFGLETWMTRGPMFDGEAFKGELAPSLREKILHFWKTFRAEFGDYPIETRGTNLSTGVDLASDGVPLADIYRGDFGIRPPPNSPWAALNGDFGLELSGYMSHIAELPPEGHNSPGGYPFRYYTHDPWWLNSPWLDRYNREPHDIYMPLAVSRVTETGDVQNPNAILFLTADDSLGNLPDQVPEEVIPHIKDAVRTAPDRPGPAVWVYPFDEYHELTFSQPARVGEPFAADWFIRSAIDSGFPLNTVVSARNFVGHAKAKPGLYAESVLVTPVPDRGSPLNAALIAHVSSGGRAILYGAVAHADPALLDLLNLQQASPLSGAMHVTLHGVPDELGKPYPTEIEHRNLMCGGGCDAVLGKPNDAGTTILATGSQGGGQAWRVMALCRRDAAWNGGAVAYVRGTNSCAYKGGDIISGRGHLPTDDDTATHFHADVLMRFALHQLGTSVAFKLRGPAQRKPVTTVSRHDNAFYFAGFVPDTTAELRLKFPAGAPVLQGCDAELVDGVARYRMPRAWRRECRIFVEQQNGVVSCIERCVEMIGVKRRIRVVGLDGAVVRVYAPHDAKTVTMVNNGSYPYFEGPFAKFREEQGGPLGRCFVSERASGELLVSW
jgi:hypothetical protein